MSSNYSYECQIEVAMSSKNNPAMLTKLTSSRKPVDSSAESGAEAVQKSYRKSHKHHPGIYNHLYKTVQQSFICDGTFKSTVRKLETTKPKCYLACYWLRPCEATTYHANWLASVANSQMIAEERSDSSRNKRLSWSKLVLSMLRRVCSGTELTERETGRV